MTIQSQLLTDWHGIQRILFKILNNDFYLWNLQNNLESPVDMDMSTRGERNNAVCSKLCCQAVYALHKKRQLNGKLPVLPD